ncbi:MAG TPA: hypothetical protein VHG70_01425 [Nocardioidaceae bacterium]|nr:hypothetical protein [Nocardioidaceae bacterium]
MRTRSASVLGASLALFLGVVPVTGAPAAFATSARVCDGTIGNVVVDRLEVPEGATCRLHGTTVRDSVDVEEGGRLIARDAMIDGDVHATEGPRTVRLLDTEVSGNIHVRRATGPVVIGNAGCRVDPVAGGNIALVHNSGDIAVCQMSIRGNLHLIRNSGRIGVFANRVGNNLHARENTGAITRLRRNRVGTSGSGNMEVRDNAGSVRVHRNRVASQLVCRGNAEVRDIRNAAGGGMRHQCA